MGRLKDIIRAMAGTDTGQSPDFSRDRSADALRPGHVWIAGRRFPAPSASSLMALCMFGSAFVNVRGSELMDAELAKQVIVACYCLEMQRDAIPAAHAKDMDAASVWADSALDGIDYRQAAMDLSLAISATARGFELFSDDDQKKTTAKPRSRAGVPSMGWLSRLFRRDAEER